MPFSTSYFKEQTKKYIVDNFDTKIKILDIGAGCGTYSDLLKPLGYDNIDCVEVFEKYIKEYHLYEKYNNIFLGDVTEIKIDFKNYDLIILGDVMEHIEHTKAIDLISKFKDVPTIIGIPFESPQGEHFGNKYEIHLQDDLTLHSFLVDYDNFHPLCLRFDYGIFINELPKQIYLEVGEKEIPNEYYDLINQTYENVEKTYLNRIEIMEQSVTKKITLVTGLWDIGREDLKEGWSRSYNHYLDKFSQLLEVEENLIIFGDKELEDFVFKTRSQKNTQFVLRNLDWFINNEFYTKIQEIRNSPSWYNQVGWLSDSTQAKLELYNPLVMSKLFLLHDAKILDRFNSEYLFWIDAGICNTIHPGYFTHDKVLDKLTKYLGEFNFVCFPYETQTEIHGFVYSEMNEITKSKINKVARGGFFGGKKEVLSEINGIYYQLLNETLSNGLMGTEESIFTLMVYLYPNLISYFEIEGNGLMGKFFEDLKNDTLEIMNEEQKNNEFKSDDISKVGLYVITFNSPNQFETLIKSMLDYDPDFINKPKKFLLDNSTDLTTTPRYKELCDEYGFEHIKKDNLGIMGGRVFVAEHFNETDLDYYFWFEDDMFFYPKNETCKNGFNRYVTNIYQKGLEIIQKEKFDFLKLNYTEFYGDNGTQWAWYNVPQDFRQKHWPNNPKLPQIGLDSNSPKTKFDFINTHKGIPYVSGEIYLCNWPIIFTKEGNYKCYLETKWAHPFEQTLMSYCYQETIKGNIKPGLLLMTPTEHNRFDHYDGKLRKES